MTEFKKNSNFLLQGIDMALKFQSFGCVNNENEFQSLHIDFVSNKIAPYVKENWFCKPIT